MSFKENLLGAKSFRYQVVAGDSVNPVEGGVIDERLVSIYVNGQALATMMCSPLQLEALAVGFLFNEGVIESFDEIGIVQCNLADSVIDVILTHDDFQLPRRMILTSGCGGGVTWQELSDSHSPLETDVATSPSVILRLMHGLRSAARLYNAVRGVHTAVLADEAGILVSAEDVGRHNAVDKIAGEALMQGILTGGRILLTSGRISSEMLGKARRMGTPIVASRTAPTSITLALAQVWNICVVGYVRGGSMRVYTHSARLGLND